MKRYVLFGLLLAVVMLAQSCLILGSDPSEPAEGSVELSLVLQPPQLDGLESLVITFSEILIHREETAELEDGEWLLVVDQSLPAADRTFDLVNYMTGDLALLGGVSAAPGTYTQIRLVIEAATITVAGSSSELTIPSGSETGIKLVGGFSVDPKVITELVLDMAGGSSLRESPAGSGQYRMQPTVRMIERIISGTISGAVGPADANALIRAFEAGTTTQITSSMADSTDGTYVLHALLAGSYDIEVSAEGFQTSREEGIEVVAGVDSAGHDFTLTPAGGGD